MGRVDWNIRRRGRAWHGDEADERWQLTPEKFEMDEGKLFWSDEQRLALLGLLLENVGADAAVRLGDPTVWRAAVASLFAESDSRTGPTNVPWVVVEVRILPHHRLFVRFVDGTEGEVDAAPMIHGPNPGVFKPLRDEARFAEAYVDDGAVTWPGELDLAPDAMYDEIKANGRWTLKPFPER